jgi:hypothetical protein
MGSLFSKFDINFYEIYTTEQIFDLLNKPNHYLISQLVAHFKCNPTRPLMIYICDEYSESDVTNNEDKTEIMEDFILSHGKYQFYIAEIFLIRYTWHINIVKRHKNYPTFEQCYINNYIISGLNNCMRATYDTLASQLIQILGSLRRDDIYDDIWRQIIEMAKSHNYKPQITYENKICDNFYEMYNPVPSNIYRIINNVPYFNPDYYMRVVIVEDEDKMD